MWSDEVERIAFKRCTPAGYALRLVGDVLRFISLTALFAMLAYLVFRAFAGTLAAQWFGMLIVPFLFGLAGTLAAGVSRRLARRNGFAYSYEQRAASWTANGMQHAYTYDDWVAEFGDRDGE